MILLLLSVVLASVNSLQASATEQRASDNQILSQVQELLMDQEDDFVQEESNDQEEQKQVIDMLPVSSNVILRKELGTAKIPLIITGNAIVYDVTSNREDFKATYENETLIVTNLNPSSYADKSDVIVEFTITGIDDNLYPFERKLTITFEVDSRMNLKEIIELEQSVDVSHMDSYSRTLRINEFDRKLIAHSRMDFSETTIACLGDSITEGVGVTEGMEEKYSYPAELKKILDAKEVINLGEGGTSISSYWDSFIKNINGIPENVDIIIVLGGINDCYSGKKENLGSLEECELGTFYGDTDFLMKELKEEFPDAQIIFATPLTTITTTSYLSFLPNMLPLYYYANAIKELGEQNEVAVLDMYYDHFLDSNDETIIQTYMYDGVHPNDFGYQLLAEHIAGEIIRLYVE